MLALSVISCILSIIGGAVIFASFWALPEIRNFQSRRLVICLTVADSITATAYLMSVIDYAIPYNYNNNKTNNFQYLNDSIPETAVCKVQSFFTTYSSLVSFFMTSIIAVYIFDSVVNRTDRLGNTKWLLVFNIVSWVIPGMFLLVNILKCSE